MLPARSLPASASADSFAVLAGDTITNTGPTTITGDLGLHPGTAVTGAPVVFGAMNVTNQAALDAKNALRSAYVDAQGRSGATLIPGGALGGLTLGPGLYKHGTAGLQSLGIASGETLVLNGSADDVWIFQTDSTLIAETGTTVRFQGGAQACNVFWQVGSAATLRAGSKFVGTVMAHDDITLETGATVLDGRLLAGAQANGAGALVLDTNTITRSDCATVVPPVDTTPVTTTTPTTTTTTDDPDGHNPGSVDRRNRGQGRSSPEGSRQEGRRQEGSSEEEGCCCGNDSAGGNVDLDVDCDARERKAAGQVLRLCRLEHLDARPAGCCGAACRKCGRQRRCGPAERDAGPCHTGDGRARHAARCLGGAAERFRVTANGLRAAPDHERADRAAGYRPCR